MRIIDRVLANAGFEGTDSVVHSGTRGDAARYLVDKFQSGTRTEEELSAALAARAVVS
jgi:hypothetical protein